MDHRLQSGTLAQTAVLNVTPNGFEGAIWMQAQAWRRQFREIYFLDANGDFDTTLNSSGFPANVGLPQRLPEDSRRAASPSPIISDEQSSIREMRRRRLGSGGAMVLPDLSDGAGHTLHLAYGAGKDQNLYVVNPMLLK